MGKRAAKKRLPEKQERVTEYWLDQSFFFSGIDGFFLLFYGAWVSINQDLWSNDIRKLLLIVFATLALLVIINEFRGLAIKKEPLTVLSFGSILFLISVFILWPLQAVLDYFNESGAIELGSDYWPIVILSVLWVVLSLVLWPAKKIRWVFTKKDGS